MDTVYIETSIVSYATAWPSKNVQIAALQEQARDWWSIERPKFELVTSQLTLDEAATGDSVAAAERFILHAVQIEASFVSPHPRSKRNHRHCGSFQVSPVFSMASNQTARGLFLRLIRRIGKVGPGTSSYGDHLPL